MYLYSGFCVCGGLPGRTKTAAESTAVICIFEFASLHFNEPSGVDGFSYVEKGPHRDGCSQHIP
jgi:hypothetical protein